MVAPAKGSAGIAGVAGVAEIARHEVGGSLGRSISRSIGGSVGGSHAVIPIRCPVAILAST